MSQCRFAWFVVMVVLTGATSAWADEPPIEALVPPPRTGWRVQGLPLLNFNSDEGFGYGARLLLVDAGDGTYRPYRHSLIAQFFQTTRGVATHRLMMDAPRFFDSDWRLGLDLSFINERFSPYFGQGAAAGYEPDFAQCDDREQLEDARDVCAGNPSFRGLRYYSFEQRTLPSVVFNARRTLRGPLQVSVGYRFRLTRIRSRYSAKDLGQSRDSRLEEDARAGLLTGLEAGGGEGTFRTAEVTAGLLWDSRDNEPAPVRGMFHELAVRGAVGATGSSFSYWGSTANLRFYHPLGHERLVAALRLMADVLGGDVPFFLLSGFGGVEWRDGWGGVGGLFTARGLLKNRLQGEVKTVGNGELRWRFLDVRPWEQRLEFTLVAFLDAGQVWTDLRFRDKGLFRYAGGGGLRVAWDNAFIVRADYGVSPRDGTSAFYLDFNHMF
ncbi:Omp85 family outer membrane protein [Myxococcus eversor]|nr:BamA/TamA family outer membrane protein [Myxococcus eversor]